MSSRRAPSEGADDASSGNGPRVGASSSAPVHAAPVHIASGSDQLIAALCSACEAHRSARAFVLLSYAQSLDGSIAARRGTPTAISCAASLRMTHELRSALEGIVVGVGTLLSDDPSLTVRLVPGGRHPVVVVVDRDVRAPPGCRAFEAWRARGAERGPAPVVAHGPPPLEGPDGARRAWLSRRDALLEAGVRCIEVPLWRGGGSGDSSNSGGASTPPSGAGPAPLREEQGHLDLPALTAALCAPPFALHSLLVEGGASLLASFAAQHAAGGGLVHALIVTVAPLLLPGGLHIGGGNAGAGKCAEFSLAIHLEWLRAAMVGADLVVYARPRSVANYVSRQ